MGMELVVVENQLLQGIWGASATAASARQFLLQSLSLDITSKLLTHLASLAQGLCSAPSFSPAVPPCTSPPPA